MHSKKKNCNTSLILPNFHTSFPLFSRNFQDRLSPMDSGSFLIEGNIRCRNVEVPEMRKIGKFRFSLSMLIFFNLARISENNWVIKNCFIVNSLEGKRKTFWPIQLLHFCAMRCLLGKLNLNANEM